MAMVLIPPGDLPLHGGETTPIEKPFRMGACEATVGQFRAFVKARNYRTTSEAGHGGMTMHTGTPAPDPNANWEKPGVPTSDEHPVTQVAYHDAVAFCEWLSAQESAPYRLPTMDEWRWACKAGSHAAYYFGDDAKLLPQYAWVRENAPLGPQPVGKLKPNSWGLFDMLGNVREWSSDIGGPPGRKFRMVAGGSTTSDPRQQTVEGKGGFEDWVASSGLGFRVVREIQ
jgi:formylglycine-generating enzyme required for sulfatase activity